MGTKLDLQRLPRQYSSVYAIPRYVAATMPYVPPAGAEGAYWYSAFADQIYTTGSVLIRGNLSATSATEMGTDVFFYITGSVTPDFSGNDKSVFGGDLIISGSTSMEGDTLEVSGSVYVTGDVLNVDGTLIVTASIMEFTGSMIVTGSMSLDGTFVNGLGSYAAAGYSQATGIGTFVTDVYARIYEIPVVGTPGQIIIEDTGRSAGFAVDDYVAYVCNLDESLPSFDPSAVQVCVSKITNITPTYLLMYGDVYVLDVETADAWDGADNYNWALYDGTPTYRDPTYITTNTPYTLFKVSQTGTDLYAHAEGSHTLAYGLASHSEGYKNAAGGEASHAEGAFNRSTGIASHAEGFVTEALGDYSHAEGYATLATAKSSHAEGIVTTTLGDYSHAEGSTTTTHGSYSHAEGLSTTTYGSHSHAEGNGTIAGTGAGQFVSYQHSEGDTTRAYGAASHAEGYDTQTGDYSNSFTYSAEWGAHAHSEGEGTKAYSRGSHAEGYQTTAGDNTDDYSIVASRYAHSEGSNTRAFGEATHAEGHDTEAVGMYSHAEGDGSRTASGATAALAVGSGTIACGVAQAAMGRYNLDLNTVSLFVVGNGADDSNRSDVFRIDPSSVQVTGSFAVSGSSELLGDVVEVSGSFIVSGSTELIGSIVEISGSLLVSGSVVIDGDLTVTGDTTTVNTVNLEINDAIVGLGFASGTVAAPAGDRGIIGGISGGDNVTLLWKDSEGEFSLGRTASSATGSLPIVLSNYSNLHVENIQAAIVTASAGFSGSLTTLHNGDPYLRAGENITIVTGSGGWIEITGSAPAYFFSTLSGSAPPNPVGYLYTTGSVAFSGGGDEYAKNTVDKGADVFFYVSGSQGSKDSPDPGAALFGGDVVISGTLHGGSPLKIGTDIGVTGSLYVSGTSTFDDLGRSTSQVGSDVYFFVSGAYGAKDGPEPGVALFGGDVIVSGALISSQGINVAGDVVEITGSLYVSGTSTFDDLGRSTSQVGSDVYFFVSGAFGAKDGPTPGVAVFEGDVVVSGSLNATSYVVPNITASFLGTYSHTTDSFSGAGPFAASLKSFIIVDPSTSDPTILTLPADPPNGLQVIVKRNDVTPNTSSLWVSGAVGEAIDGSTGAQIDTNWGSMTFVWVGSTWYTT